ncbi:ribosomal RNA processing protein 1 homolog B [Etheostoma spectabile]|uniref:ribosomal RNA processing protein 1 homolog B n=1 Tax=Etheostoma spectabile TaxID=54343 RepID=UPI0013AFC2D1|nr:ribosomal RNA processing protein 1 homolog B [Etheostoma spectabile]
MASIQEPEVQFAQRLASNEKPIRTKAIKKLRKYINVRSRNPTGGFTGDELLKLWKGLFYCLWMQDKPLLQEELSNQISTLIHSFCDIDGQLLYLESFLQTFKREWTGIDRLRMDKFFQLVRFMFRQTFEMLKRKHWESCVIGRFVELLTTQLLQSTSGAPSGLQFHILDLYMTELAAVGSAELTADQNLIFIQPFCKTAAKTKDRSLFSAICNSIFSTIIDQAPFAIEDLMKEVKAEASDSDSGQASEEDGKEDQLKGKMSKPVGKKGTWKQINGNISNKEAGDEDDEDYDNELLHLEESDTEESCDEDVGPVLQFDYAALADKLFELASRSSTPSQNRQRLYKIIRVLRDLSEGIFPQDEYPEEVSTDEDDEMFGSRKRMKRRGGRVEEEEEDEGVPSAKKRKGKKKEASTLNKQNEELVKDDKEPADLTANNETKKKRRKRKKKKKAGEGGSAGGEEIAARSEQGQIKETEEGVECSQTEDLGKEAQTKQSSISSVEVSEAATPEGQRATLLVSEVKKPPTVTVTEETSLPTLADKDQSEQFSKREASELKPLAAEEQQTGVQPEPDTSSNADTALSGKKKKKKGLKAKSQTDETVAKSQLNTEAEVIPVSSEESAEKKAPDIDATTPAKKKKKNLNAEKNLKEVEVETQVGGVGTEVDFPLIHCEDPSTRLERPSDSTATCNKKSKKKNLIADIAAQVEAEAQFEVEGKPTDAEITSVPLKKKTKKKGKQVDASLEALPAADESAVTLLKKKRKKTQKESETLAAALDTEELQCEVSMTTPAKKKKKKKLAAAQVDEKDPTQLPVVGIVDAEPPLDEIVSSSRKEVKKKRKIPVVFEYEADELEAAAQEATSINGLAQEETVAKKLKPDRDVDKRSTPLSTKKSTKKLKTTSSSDFITFQSKATVPTPLFCKTKGRPSTPLSSKKKSQTPKSESKKVTFGLKNNKTAEFRKTDRSLLLSPDGPSRVPFDPKQKPKFGVLKSPPTPLSARKTPKANRKTGSNTPKSTPKGRPTAADFF